jgi:hypothetical protein
MDKIDIDLSITFTSQSVDSNDRRETYCTAPEIFPGLPETPFHSKETKKAASAKDDF